jgi:glycogen operon protein
MVVAGDEFGRTQNGNNNPWNVDSVATWNNYRMIATTSPNRIPTGGGGAYHNNFGTAAGPAGENPLFALAGYLARKRRAWMILRAGTAAGDCQEDYVWRREDGKKPVESWNRAVWLHIAGSPGAPEFLIFLNMYHQSISFAVPTLGTGQRWARIIDTAAWAEAQHNCWAVEQASTAVGSYRVHPFSVVVMERTSVARE